MAMSAPPRSRKPTTRTTTTRRRAIAVHDGRQHAARMGLGMAAVKAADGRMFACMAQLLRLWCVTAEAVCVVQPDSFLIDFYDAPFIVTTPAAWGDDGRDETLLFWRGSLPPSAPQRAQRAHHARLKACNEARKVKTLSQA